MCISELNTCMKIEVGGGGHEVRGKILVYLLSNRDSRGCQGLIGTLRGSSWDHQGFHEISLGILVSVFTGIQ